MKEQDVYICDYRLDKSAHLFYKIHRNRYPVCTKPYAFNHFPKRLAPKRDFSVSAGGGTENKLGEPQVFFVQAPNHIPTRWEPPPSG